MRHPDIRLVLSFVVPLAFGCAYGCADPGCPTGTEEGESGRCLAPPDAEGPAEDAGTYDPDAEPEGFVIVEVPTSVVWIEAGEALDVELRTSTAPSFYGPLTLELEGLPEDVAPAPGEDFSGSTFELRAEHGAPVGEIHDVTVRAYVTERPTIVGEAIFALGVRGAPGAFDTSFDGDGVRTDVPLDGTRDEADHVAIAEDGTIVVAGSGQDGEIGVGFVSWYAPNGSPAPGMAAGPTRPVEIVGDRLTRVQGILPRSDGLLVAVEGASEHVLRFDEEGNIDRRFTTDPSVVRPSYLHGGQLYADGDGFIVSFTKQFERYHADGTLDRDFGEDGVVAVPGELTPHIAFFPDGSMVWASTSYTAGKILQRFDASGAPHLAFGTRGVVELGGIRIMFGVVPLEDGGFVFATSGLAVLPEYFVGSLIRIGPDGVIDGGFGLGGERVVDDLSGAALGLYGIAAHAGRIYGYGTRFVEGEALRGFVVAYTEDGALDPEFGDDGFVDLGELVLPSAGVVDEDSGRLVLACDRPLSAAPDASRMIAVVRLWL